MILMTKMNMILNYFTSSKKTAQMKWFFLPLKQLKIWIKKKSTELEQ